MAEVSVVAAALAVCAFLLFFELGANGFRGDEGIYAMRANRVEATGQWAPIPGFSDAYVSKPPISIWGVALAFAAFGESELWGRAPAAFAAWLLCVVTAVLALRCGAAFAAAIAPLLLVTSPNLMFQHGLRDAVTEAWLLLAMVLAFASWRLTLDRPLRQRMAILAAISIPLGLTKGLIGPLIVAATIGLTALFFRTRDSRRVDVEPFRAEAAKLFLAAFVPGAVASLSWIAFSLRSFAGLVNFLHVDIVKRATTGIDPIHLRPPSVLFTVIWRDFGWLSIVGPAVLALGLAGLGKIRGTGRLDRAFLLIWIAVVLAIFLPVRSRLDWYVYPAFPALSLAAALALGDIYRIASGRRVARAAVVVGIACLFAFRAAHLAASWPPREAQTLASLARILAADSEARVFRDKRLNRYRVPGLFLGDFHRIYLDRFTLLDPTAGLPARPACAFVVTHDPPAWSAWSREMVDPPGAVLQGNFGEAVLYVLDYCGGRFARSPD